MVAVPLQRLRCEVRFAGPKRSKVAIPTANGMLVTWVGNSDLNEQGILVRVYEFYRLHTGIAMISLLNGNETYEVYKQQLTSNT